MVMVVWPMCSFLILQYTVCHSVIGRGWRVHIRVLRGLYDTSNVQACQERHTVAVVLYALGVV